MGLGWPSPTGSWVRVRRSVGAHRISVVTLRGAAVCDCSHVLGQRAVPRGSGLALGRFAKRQGARGSGGLASKGLTWLWTRQDHRRFRWTVESLVAVSSALHHGGVVAQLRAVVVRPLGRSSFIAFFHVFAQPNSLDFLSSR